MRPRRLLTVVVSAALGAAVIAGTAMGARGASSHQASTRLPVKAMDKALHAKGSVTGENLNVPIDRTDIKNVHIGNVPIKPSFEINGEFDFQPIGRNRAFMNGDIAVKPNEINSFINGILRNGLTFQAEHQYTYDFKPIVWFIHVRGEGKPVALAEAAHDALEHTATPFPQAHRRPTRIRRSTRTG
jgi:hypothetical protein